MTVTKGAKQETTMDRNIYEDKQKQGFSMYNDQDHVLIYDYADVRMTSFLIHYHLVNIFH